MTVAPPRRFNIAQCNCPVRCSTRTLRHQSPMPSLFVTGEILGASGLSSTAGDSDLSLWTLIDFLALQSSTWHDYFCTWRLVLGPRSDIPGSNAEGGWQVLQGLTSGQTQLHHATMGGLGVSNLANTSTFECDTATSPTLDAVWAHPIDLHLACKSSFDEWPKLEFAVRFVSRVRTLEKLTELR